MQNCVENTRMKNIRMNIIHKFLILLLSDRIILNYIKTRCITFKNAQRCIILSDNDVVDVNNIIFNMIKSENPYDVFYTKTNYNYGLIKPCCISDNHKSRVAQPCYYKISPDSLNYCNNCVDMMTRFSKKTRSNLCNFYHKKLIKTFILIKKSSIYCYLDVDSFNMIFSYYLITLLT